MGDVHKFIRFIHSRVETLFKLFQIIHYVLHSIFLLKLFVGLRTTPPTRGCGKNL